MERYKELVSLLEELDEEWAIQIQELIASHRSSKKANNQPRPHQAP